MSRPPDYMYRISEKLSEVMDDIGVNEKVVMKRRVSVMLSEAFGTLTNKHLGNRIMFHLGSRCEGSTTFGLESDCDYLIPASSAIFLQHMWEWKPKVLQYMMIQNENISPGYCCAQYIRSDIPAPISANDMITLKREEELHGIDREGRVLKTNLFETRVLGNLCVIPMQQNGPALTLKRFGNFSEDYVYCHMCTSSPLQAIPWLQKITESTWPSEDLKIICRTAGCLMVPVGSKLSDMPELEWRISTSLQERWIMFSLNITRLRCYVLMKMILKTHINPHVEDVLSSFMCKNVLLYCVYNSSHESSHEWHTGNLLSYLHLCLFMLKERILQRNCPHFMIPENNLLAGRMTDAQRGQLLDIIDKLMEDKEELLYKIQIDDLGTRLMMKLNIIPSSPVRPSATDTNIMISGIMTTFIAVAKWEYIKTFQMKMCNENLDVTQRYMSEFLTDLKKERAEGNPLQQYACERLLPFVKSALGSVMASISIDAQTAISDEAFTYLEAGRESDVLSGRLKLASVLFSTGNNERAEFELRIIQKPKVGFQCNCHGMVLKSNGPELIGSISEYYELAFRSSVIWCTRFLKCEINCIPHELGYEILRSYLKVDRKIRTKEDSTWMDYIVVDSVPYLYFLQYKTYGRLHRRKEQLEALFDLEMRIKIEHNIGHKETALNLLGQCLEQEKRHAKAVHCYIRSLIHRERNNAARFLLCIHLLKLWKKYNV